MGGKRKAARDAEADARRGMERWMAAINIAPGRATSSSDPSGSRHATAHATFFPPAPKAAATAKVKKDKAVAKATVKAAEAAKASPKKRPRRLEPSRSDPEEAVEATLAPVPIAIEEPPRRRVAGLGGRLAAAAAAHRARCF